MERETSYQGIPFADLDTNRDGFVTRTELQNRGRERLNELHTALASGDSAAAAALLPESETPGWVSSLLTADRPEILLSKLAHPVIILHGIEDRYFPVAASRALRGRAGLTVKLYPAHDGELNWKRYAEQGRISDGMLGLIESLFTLCGLPR
jgi:pimeloyl-ACP methyl ester carboxylesterase